MSGRLFGGLVGASALLSWLLVRPAMADYLGIVGMGYPMYEELCCLGCNDALSMLNLFCTTDIMMMGDMLMGTTTDECRRASKPWLETMAYCLRTRCDAEGYPAKKTEECFTIMAVGGMSKPTLQDSLPETPPTVELSFDEAWLNQTSLVNAEAYRQTRNTYAEMSREEKFHSLYSVINYVGLMGLMVSAGLMAQLISACPSLYKHVQVSALASTIRAHVTMPALFGGRRAEPLPYRLGYLPGRALSLCIFLYVAANILFSAVSFRSVQPNNWYASTGAEIAEYVGNRTGVLCMVNISIAVLLAGRNCVLASLTGWGPSTFLTWHRWTARVATCQVVAHSLCYTVMYWEPGFNGWVDFAHDAADPYFRWGMTGTVAFCLAVGIAALPLRARFYEAFLMGHIFWVALGLVGTWYHLVLHFNYRFNYQIWLYMTFAYWGFDRLVRLVRIFLYSHVDGSLAVARAVPGTRLLELTVYPRRTAGFGPGQHTFVYLHRTGFRFWENHPFSVAGWTHGGQRPLSPLPAGEVKTSRTSPSPSANLDPTANRPSIRFLVRVHSGATSRILSRRWEERNALVTEVYVEGPYGGHSAGLAPLLVADTILCIVGGVGITNALGYVQAFREAARARKAGAVAQSASRLVASARRLIVAWSAREMGLFAYVRAEYLDAAAQDGVESCYWYTGAKAGTTGEAHAVMAGGNLRAGRMHLPTVIRSSLEPGLHTAVVVCGPATMADEATRQVVQCVKEGYRVGLVQEAFYW